MNPLLLVFMAALSGADAVSFSKQIRPILADRCYACHGPDAAQRKADLRLDQEAAARSVLVPGDAKSSDMVARLLSDDPGHQMPPPTSKLQVSQEEISLITRWIDQGAQWEQHWAFVPPVRQVLPTVENRAWPRNAIDRFILSRLEAAGMQPNGPATKSHWLRRVTLDVTGMPPTLAELDAFLADESAQSYESVVDRLLKSAAFGERMAQEWLDVSRYGDTDGLFEDHPRSIYPWRDWVIDAFNANLPYHQFLTWQLAGDLLPDATVAQRVATGFIRNNPTSNEGGIIDEDYRVKYLVDRVNTTATAMLGLTLECAQCHDHKYDPMTQREYYQFAGFFNGLVGKGNTKGASAPTLRDYTPAQATRLKTIDNTVPGLQATLQSSPPQLTTDFEQWLADLNRPVSWKTPALVSNASLRVEADWWVRSKKAVRKATHGAAPVRGRYVRVALPAGATGFLTLSEVEVFSRGANIGRLGKATQSSVGYNAPAAKALDGKRNGSFASCSCTNEERDAWWEVDLGGAFPIDSVAVWNRTDCCPERLDRVSIQILDESRRNVAQRVLAKAGPRNTLPAGAVDGVKAEKLDFRLQPTAGSLSVLRWESRVPDVIEVAKVQHVQDEKKTELKLLGDTTLKLNGQPVLVALAAPLQVAAGEYLELTIQCASSVAFRVSTSDNASVLLRATLPKEKEKRLAHYRTLWPVFAPVRKRLERLLDEKKRIESSAALTMVAAEMASPRENRLLIRGEYDRPGKRVETAAPGSIMPFADTLPRNRLGLAQWLTQRNNPLTARVVVNRYWQLLFGTGIVRTSEDFGTQGEQPSHAALLDWLAVDFMDSGWDVKALLGKMVLSATYRQASTQAAEDHRRDPENRMLSRGPRRRLPAEAIRDHALAISGLLVEQLGGPGVNPYQPAELFGANAIGAANAKFTQSTGASLYRRSLYTYWKRQIPAANMRILGADGRTKCRTRRERTNTPLQALVLLNDPQFVEAARQLASRAMRRGGRQPAEWLEFAFRLATSRQATAVERDILLAEYADRVREFRGNDTLAIAYLTQTARDATPDLDPAQWAACAAVCSLILNLDESISAS
ncbi:MAG: DUF1553 domain-containing protein [Planctomycetota bacterium]|nr:DUF1553 domain-containing protein [Planctomycetota bacterium]